MNLKLIIEYASFSELAVCIAVIFFVARRSALVENLALTSYVVVRALIEIVDIPMLFFRKSLGLSKLVAYNIYFYVTWPCVVLEAVLMIVIVYSIYEKALRPFEPLKKLGFIMFRWVAGISFVVSIGVAVGPQMFGKAYAATVVSQIQQSASVLTLCLLVFVCLALRPLGITMRSRLFGASLGLGVLAAVQLIQSAWLPTPTALSLYSPLYMYSGVASCIAMMVWAAYFALPEPKNRMVLLPTTSPYFFWNKISEALGDAPGFVVVGGFTPDSLAPGELEGLMATSEERPLPRPQVLQPIAVSR